jgi:uncharacterized protein YegL
LKLRRLPVYILIETAGGMRGERIEAVKNGLDVMISKLRQDPFALESVYISIIKFDRVAELIVPLTELSVLQIPDIEIPQSSPPHTGEALEYLFSQVDKELIRGNESQKGDWRPLLFILTRGVPADKQEFKTAIVKIKSLNFATIVVCTAGSRNSEEDMKLLTKNLVHLDTADINTLSSFFKWVSSSIGVGNMSASIDDDIILPPPPPEVQPVI